MFQVWWVISTRKSDCVTTTNSRLCRINHWRDSMTSSRNQVSRVKQGLYATNRWRVYSPWPGLKSNWLLSWLAEGIKDLHIIAFDDLNLYISCESSISFSSTLVAACANEDYHEHLSGIWTPDQYLFQSISIFYQLDILQHNWRHATTCFFVCATSFFDPFPMLVKEEFVNGGERDYCYPEHECTMIPQLRLVFRKDPDPPTDWFDQN